MLVLNITSPQYFNSSLSFSVALEANILLLEYFITLNNNENYDLIIKTLRIADKLEQNRDFKDKIEVITEKYSITINYLKKVEIKDNTKEKEELKKNIARRTALLNSPFKDKAPASLIEEEKNKLKSEEALLKQLL